MIPRVHQELKMASPEGQKRNKMAQSESRPKFDRTSMW